MTTRTWLIVTAAVSPSVQERDWFVELGAIPDALAPRDRMAIVSWADRGLERRAMLLGTASVAKLSVESHLLRLRHRVSAVPGHEVPVTGLGAGLACARGWSTRRRPDLLGGPRPISESDFTRIEDALLAIAHEFGPPPKRPVHRQPRTPGRRALIAARAGLR